MHKFWACYDWLCPVYFNLQDVVQLPWRVLLLVLITSDNIISFFAIIFSYYLDFIDEKKGLLPNIMLIHSIRTGVLSNIKFVFLDFNIPSRDSAYLRLVLHHGYIFLYLSYLLKSLNWFTETILCKLWGYRNFCNSWDIHCFCCNRSSCVSN